MNTGTTSRKWSWIQLNEHRAAREGLLLSVLLLALPAALQAQFTYVVNNGTITITGYTGPGGAVTIPSTMAGLRVTSIRDEAFAANSTLTSVTIPASITSIGAEAFIVCPNLIAIIVAANNPVYSSADGVLFDKAQASLIEFPPGRAGSYNVPGGVSSIGRYALYCCYNVTDVSLPDTVTTIGDWAFAECYSITNVGMPRNLIVVGANAFEACSGLTEVALPDSVGRIGQGAFAGCGTLANINIPSGTHSIEYAAFWQCGRLASIIIPEGVTNIDKQAFWSSGLTNVTFPKSLTSIGYEAFAACNLTGVFIPSSITSMGPQAFDQCPYLQAINVDPSNPSYSSVVGILYDKGKTSLLEYPQGRAGDCSLPSTVTTVLDYACYACTGLSSLELPDSVMSIGDWAFYSCGLTNVVGGRGIVNIGSEAFYGCGHLTSFPIGDHVSQIGYEAFGFCNSLRSVAIPNSVTSIASYAFNDCSGLTNVTFGNSVTNIGMYAFSGTGLRSVTLPNSLTALAQGAFDSCLSLASVTIPGSVINLSYAVFMSCSALTTVNFEGDAPGVAANTFSGATMATVYYLLGTSGWGATFGGRPTAVWPRPTISKSPLTQTVEWGSEAYLQVQASGPSLVCLWYLNRTNLLICGTSRELELTNVQFSQSGAYTAVITNAAGAVTSSPVMLQVIEPVERRPVPGVKLMGEAGSVLNVDYANSLCPAPIWTQLGSISLTGTSGYCFDPALPLPAQRYYRAWQTSPTSQTPTLDLHLVPAITLTGTVGGSVRVDYINRFGPIDAWVTLATVTLTNTSQLYFDVSAPGQPQRLYRLVPAP